MSAEQNKAIVRRLFLESIGGNLAIADDLVAPEYVYHHPDEPLRGPEGWKAFVRTVRAGFPDVQMTIEGLIAEGDTVVVRHTARGTHQGEFRGLAPTGKPVTVTGISICRLANGKVVEEWEQADELGMMQQIGAVPTPARTA